MKYLSVWTADWRALCAGGLLIGVVAFAALGLAQPPRGPTSPPGPIVIDGSSTVEPVTSAIAEEFRKTEQGKNVRITVGISGTGGGFKKFCSDNPPERTDIQDASRPITAKEHEKCTKNQIKYIEIPVAIDGLAVVVNKQNSWARCLTVGELGRMWEPSAEGKIKSWKQIRATFPDRPLVLAGPGPDSGTFDFFTEVIVGKAKASRGDYLASEDDNVIVQAVAGDINALGYFGLAYLEQNLDELIGVTIDPSLNVDLKSDAECKGVEPNFDNVLKGTYQPLSRPIFIYPNLVSVNGKPEMVQFVTFYLGKDGVRKEVKDRRNPGKTTLLVRQVGYVEFPDKVYELALVCFNKRITGSAFVGKDGKPIGFATVPQVITQLEKRCKSL